MAKWLFKEEPTHYSFNQLQKDGKTMWDGVENNLALKNIRSVKKGDQALYYHTGDEKAVVGIMKVVSDSYPDPKKHDPKLAVVDVQPEKNLKRPVTLREIKANPKLKSIDLVRLPRLSVMPITEDAWNEILAMTEKPIR
ncbi:MAG: EVE domain-containing protein [Thaumarchaeota archaeon]|nr:EVE domain-containing protein [Nitrososphaerota archaeon]